jgi:outer membrane protein TolC
MSLIVAGCVLTPPGTDEERSRLTEAGKPYERPFEERVLPELPEAPGWRDVLRRAFLANGELEAAYFRWRAAVERVDIAGAYPNSNVSVGFSYLFSGENMKSFDRTTFTLGFDPSMNLSLPAKVSQQARVALDEARAAGERLRVTKFDLQRRVLFAWSDYTSRARSIAAVRSDVETLGLLESTAGAAVRSGGTQESVMRARIELEQAQRRLRDLESEQEVARASLNAMLARAPEAPLTPSLTADARRNTDVTDAALVNAAADMFPEVAVSVHELEGRQDALELARRQWFPDISPTFLFTGTVAQAIGAMITLPTMAPAIQAGIRVAEADVHASEALLRQKRADRIGEYVGLLVALRRAQERTAWIEGTLKPTIVALTDLRRRAYEAGAGDLAAVLEARRLLSEAEIAWAESVAQSERALVDIECCLGADIERIENANPALPVPSTGSVDQQEHHHG